MQMSRVTAREALKQLIDAKDAAILNNGKQCMSMLKDLSSGDRSGLENIQLAFDKNLPSHLVNVTSESERQNAINAMYKQLTARLNDQTAREICETFSYALSWNTTVTANPTPTPSPTPKNPNNPQQTNYNTTKQTNPVYTKKVQQQQYQNPPQIQNQVKKASQKNKAPKIVLAAVCSCIVVVVAVSIFGSALKKNNSSVVLKNNNEIETTAESNSEDEYAIADTTSDSDLGSTESTESTEAEILALHIDPIPESKTSIDKIDIQQKEDKITAEDERKQYEVTSTEAGTYRFELSDVPNDIDFHMYLYNKDMEELATDGTMGMSNGGGITYDLDANTQYYVVVEQHSNVGSYKLNIGSQKAIIDISNYTQLDDSTQFTDQRNQYAFTSIEAGTYRFELSDVPNDIDFHMYLYNKDMEKLATDGTMGMNNGGGITYDLDANTQYYVVVEQHSNVGSYKLNIGSQKATIDISGYTQLDDSTQFTDQRNQYAFTSTEVGTYRFELSDAPNDIDFHMYLYNKDMEELATDGTMGMSNGGGITYDLEANTQYYVVVEQHSGVGAYCMTYGSYVEE